MEFRRVLFRSNQLFDSWANLSQHGALGLPLDMIDFLEEGDFLPMFDKFASGDRYQNADHRWSVQDPPRARHFAIRFTDTGDSARIQLPPPHFPTEAETTEQRGGGKEGV